MKGKVGCLKRDLIQKVKLDFYKWFGKSVESKKYLHRICDCLNFCLSLSRVRMV